jgi:hypothetical protein
MVPNRNGAVTSAVLVHLRVEPAHFDWRWRERPALALLAWEALARDPLARLRRVQVESIGTTINFRPAAITHRDIAASALLIASRLALTAAVDALARRAGTSQPKAQKLAPAALRRGGKRASSPGGERCSPWSFRHGSFQRQKPAVRRASGYQDRCLRIAAR